MVAAGAYNAPGEPKKRTPEYQQSALTMLSAATPTSVCPQTMLPVRAQTDPLENVE